MCAVLHERLNGHFSEINGRIATTRHYWAENSRALIQLIQDTRQDLHNLARAGTPISISEDYERVIERCAPWLSPSGGSTIPDDFSPIELIEYEPIFHTDDRVTLDENRISAVPLKMIGEGSYATVYYYEDPLYGVRFAVKRARKTLTQRDLERFKKEFETLKRLRFPYVVEVYTYDDVAQEYRMEFCDMNLRTYFRSVSNSLSFGTRKRIALQFLYGVNYIHTQNLLHRDLSLQNVLVKKYGPAVMVKLSDFGLVKDHVASQFTLSETDMKGTIRDPMLASFKDYGLANEIYAIGWILAFILTGKESLSLTGSLGSEIISRCTSHDIAKRYSSVLEIVSAVEALTASATGTPA